MAWFILHLIVKSLAFVEVMLIVWYNVFLIEFECKWIYVMDVTTLFLILVSEIMMTESRLYNTLKTMLSIQVNWRLEEFQESL